MDAKDIYRKSERGREEIKNKNLQMLPREARTLLIILRPIRLLKTLGGICSV